EAAAKAAADATAQAAEEAAAKLAAEAEAATKAAEEAAAKAAADAAAAVPSAGETAAADIAALLSPEGFDLAQVEKLIADSALPQTEKLTLTAALKAASNSPALLGEVLTRTKAALGL